MDEQAERLTDEWLDDALSECDHCGNAPDWMVVPIVASLRRERARADAAEDEVARLRREVANANHDRIEERASKEASISEAGKLRAEVARLREAIVTYCDAVDDRVAVADCDDGTVGAALRALYDIDAEPRP